MAYDERLAERIRAVIAGRPGVSERRMFGGLCFLHDGKMIAGVLGPDLLVRVGPAGHAAAVAKPGVRVFDFTGRPSTGMVYVAPSALTTARALRAWLDRGIAYAATVPAKPRKPRLLDVRRRRRARLANP